MKRLWAFLMAFLLLGSTAIAHELSYPASAWTTREVETYSRPEQGALNGGLIAKTGQVTWLDTLGEWAYIETQGEECYVPTDALTTDHVFEFESHPTKSIEWPYAGELCISKDGALRIAISLADEYADGLIFGGAELICFEVVDDCTGELICTAEPELSCDPIMYIGEGISTQGTALLVRPVLRHEGLSVEIQW